MIIKDLDAMESIVKKNKNLIWRGWDIIDIKESNVAKTAVNGIRINDKWYIHKVYKVEKNGWNIPDKYKR